MSSQGSRFQASRHMNSCTAQRGLTHSKPHIIQQYQDVARIKTSIDQRSVLAGSGLCLQSKPTPTKPYAAFPRPDNQNAFYEARDTCIVQAHKRPLRLNCKGFDKPQTGNEHNRLCQKNHARANQARAFVYA